MRTSNIFLILLCLLLINACSSLDNASVYVFENRNRAAEYTEYGHRYLREGKYTQAKSFYTMAYDLNILIDFEPGIIQSKINIGKTYLMIHSFETAERYFSQAEHLARRTENIPLLAMVINQQGALELHLKNFTKALVLFNNALEYKDSLPDRDKAVIYHNMAAVKMHASDWASAESYIHAAIEINSSHSAFAELASNYYLLGSIVSKQGNTSEALACVNKALLYDKKIENSLGIAYNYYALGSINKNANFLEEAYENYVKSYRIFERLNQEKQCRDIAFILYQLAKDLDRLYEKELYALIYYELGGSISE